MPTRKNDVLSDQRSFAGWLDAEINFYQTEDGGFRELKYAWPLRMKLFFPGDPVGYGTVVDAVEPSVVGPGDRARAKLLIIDDHVRNRVAKQRPTFQIGDTMPRGSGRFV